MGWITGVWQRWLAVIGLISTIAGVVVFVISQSTRWAGLAIVGLATLVVALGWTVHDEHKARVIADVVPSGPSSVWLQSEARRILGAKAQRGRLIAALSDAFKAYAQWQTWSSGTFDLLGAMFGSPTADNFRTTGIKANVGAQAWAESQADWLDALLSSDDLPLMGDWRP